MDNAQKKDAAQKAAIDALRKMPQIGSQIESELKKRGLDPDALLRSNLQGIIRDVSKFAANKGQNEAQIISIVESLIQKVRNREIERLISGFGASLPKATPKVEQKPTIEVQIKAINSLPPDIRKEADPAIVNLNSRSREERTLGISILYDISENANEKKSELQLLSVILSSLPAGALTPAVSAEIIKFMHKLNQTYSGDDSGSGYMPTEKIAEFIKLILPKVVTDKPLDPRVLEGVFSVALENVSSTEINRFPNSLLSTPGFLEYLVINYADLKKFARRNSPVNDDSPETVYNVAYGIFTIGKEKVEFLMRQENGGLIHFARYPKSILESTYSALSKGLDPAKKTMLMITAQIDHNGAFYNQSNIGQATKGYNVIAMEIDSEGAMMDTLEGWKKHFGGSLKASAVIISAHGTPEAMQLGKVKYRAPYDAPDVLPEFDTHGEGASRLDSADTRLFRRLSFYTDSRPIIILNSCSTGKDNLAIAAHMAANVDARVFAPIRPTPVGSLSYDNNGLITGVSYSVPHQEFTLTESSFKLLKLNEKS